MRTAHATWQNMRSRESKTKFATCACSLFPSPCARRLFVECRGGSHVCRTETATGVELWLARGYGIRLFLLAMGAFSIVSKVSASLARDGRQHFRKPVDLLLNWRNNLLPASRFLRRLLVRASPKNSLCCSWKYFCSIQRSLLLGGAYTELVLVSTLTWVASTWVLGKASWPAASKLPKTFGRLHLVRCERVREHQLKPATTNKNPPA